MILNESQLIEAVVSRLLDEFDASIHPVDLVSIINAFYNGDVSKNCDTLQP